jgi:hypothetical protein
MRSADDSVLFAINPPRALFGIPRSELPTKYAGSRALLRQKTICVRRADSPLSPCVPRSQETEQPMSIYQEKPFSRRQVVGSIGAGLATLAAAAGAGGGKGQP